MIRLVTFDALHTLITPRTPIHDQYSRVFAPFLGVLSPDALKRSFKASLKQVQKDKPAYNGQLGAHGWWSEVIKRTAIGAGADPRGMRPVRLHTENALARHMAAVEASLDEIVSRLMDRFSSSKGYKLFDDVAPVLRQLREMNVRTALISNSDARMRLVLADLGISPFLHPLVLSEEEGIEKPDTEIFHRTFRQALGTTARLDQGVHIGDELDCDYYGAQDAGMRALLIKRPTSEENMTVDQELGDAAVISSLHGVVDWVRSQSVA